jgi:hypothetical protein
MSRTPDEILEEVTKMCPDENVIEFPDLHGALVGWANPWMNDGTRPTRLVYNGEKCVELMVAGGMSYEEASEWLSINTEGGYLGPHTPIVLHSEM